MGGVAAASAAYDAQVGSDRAPAGSSWRSVGARLTQALPVALVVLAATVAGGLAGSFTDLSVYRFGGRAVLDGLALYDVDDPVTGLPFTYPPIAAVLMVPLALPPGWLVAALWTGASIAALAATVVVVRRSLGCAAPGWWVAVVVVAALALEPVWQTLSFGQVNLLLMLVVVVDLLRPESRWSGVLLGVAAGVKLTPLVFVVLLVLVGRRSAAGRAVVAFAVTVAVGFAVMPAGATSYWTDGLVDPSRVGPPALAHNQSVSGVLTRLLDAEPPTVLWLVVAGPVAIATVLVAAAWWRRGDPVLAVGLAALASLLASPTSWSHHWAWAVPVALVLWERSRALAVAWVVVFVTRPVLWPPWGEGRELDWEPWHHVVGNGYVLAALAVAGWAAWRLRADAGEPEEPDEPEEPEEALRPSPAP